MKVRWSVVVVAAVGSILGFALEPAGPLGNMMWPLPADGPQATGLTLVSLILLGVIEALAFGLGITFLIFGWPWVSRVAANRRLAIAVYLSIGWGLVQWVPHVALHSSAGGPETVADLGRLAAIDYAFHVTAILGACIMAMFFLRVVRAQAARTERAGPASQAGHVRDA